MGYDHDLSKIEPTDGNHIAAPAIAMIDLSDEHADESNLNNKNKDIVISTCSMIENDDDLNDAQANPPKAQESASLWISKLVEYRFDSRNSVSFQIKPNHLKKKTQGCVKAASKMCKIVSIRTSKNHFCVNSSSLLSETRLFKFDGVKTPVYNFCTMKYK